jgi:superfamily II DNA or RNA helicase
MMKNYLENVKSRPQKSKNVNKSPQINKNVNKRPPINKNSLKSNISSFLKNKNLQNVSMKNVSIYLKSTGKYNFSNPNLKQTYRNITQNIINTPAPKVPKAKKVANVPKAKKVSSQNFDSMTVENLKKYAKDSGLFLDSKAKKADIINVIRRSSDLNKIETTVLMKMARERQIKVSGRESYIQALSKMNLTVPIAPKEKFPSAPPPINLIALRKRVPVLNKNISVIPPKTPAKSAIFVSKNVVVVPPAPVSKKIEYTLKTKNFNKSFSQLIQEARGGGAAVEVVNELVESIDNAVVDVEKDPESLQRWKYSPQKHQIAIRDVMMSPQRGIIAVHSLGSGKTFTATLCAETLLKAGIVKTVKVVSPASLIDNFKEELRKHGGIDQSKYTFYSYDQMISSKIKASDFRNSLMIIDEIHNIRTRKSQRAQAVLNASREATKILGLTATPVVNFMNDIEVPIEVVSGLKYPEKDSPEKVAKEFGSFFSFFDRGLNNPMYPEYTLHRVRIPMTRAYYDGFTEEKKIIKKKYSETSPGPFFTALRQACNKLEGINSKVHWCVNKTKEIYDQGGKVIIYSSFIGNGIETVKRNLKSLNISYSTISGEETQAEKTEAKENYNKNKTRVILLTKAGGEGLDLKMTDAVIILEPTWNPSGINQIIGRAVRLNSHEKYRKEHPGKRGHVDAYLPVIGIPRSLGSGLSIDETMYKTYIADKTQTIEKFYSIFTPYSLDKRPFVPNRPLETYLNLNTN